MAQSTGAYIRSRCLRPVLPQCRAFHATSKGIDHPRSSAHRLGRFQASPALKPFFLFLSHHRAVLTTCSNSTTTSDAAANTTTPPLHGRSVAPTPTASALRPCACVCNTIPTFKTLPRPLRARRPAAGCVRLPFPARRNDDWRNPAAHMFWSARRAGGEGLHAPCTGGRRPTTRKKHILQVQGRSGAKSSQPSSDKWGILVSSLEVQSPSCLNLHTAHLSM